MAVGGSPAARPISRCAIAKRVSESTTSNTFLPAPQKYSATAVAASAARMRNSGDWSEVDTTTTERSRPSSPRASSRNSPTSRPRSPTRASTVRSAPVPRAIMPISVLFPTPLPPKIPMRCPRPQVRNAIDRTHPASQRFADRSTRAAARERERPDLMLAPAGRDRTNRAARPCHRSPGPAVHRRRAARAALPRS